MVLKKEYSVNGKKFKTKYAALRFASRTGAARVKVTTFEESFSAKKGSITEVKTKKRSNNKKSRFGSLFR